MAQHQTKQQDQVTFHSLKEALEHPKPPEQKVIIQMPPKDKKSATRLDSDTFLARIALGLGGAQIGIGALCILVNLSALATASTAAGWAHGIWGGLFFIVTGSLGISATKFQSTCLIKACLVLSIISGALFAPVIVYVSCWSINATRKQAAYGSGQSLDGNGAKIVDNKNHGILATDSLLLILGLAEVIVAVISTAICIIGLRCFILRENKKRAPVAYVHHKAVPRGSNIQPEPTVAKGQKMIPLTPGIELKAI